MNIIIVGYKYEDIWKGKVVKLISQAVLHISNTKTSKCLKVGRRRVFLRQSSKNTWSLQDDSEPAVRPLNQRDNILLKLSMGKTFYLAKSMSLKEPI